MKAKNAQEQLLHTLSTYVDVINNINIIRELHEQCPRLVYNKKI